LLKPKDILVEEAASLNPIDYKLEGKLKDMISLDLPTIGFDVSGVVIEKYRCN
jgi:NADPH:quinone reductase-like Zn-dependent oxidoreductase